MPQRRTRQTIASKPTSRRGRHAAAPKASAHAGRRQHLAMRQAGNVSGLGSGSAQADHAAPTLRKVADEGKRITLPGNHEVLITRRNFLYGLAGTAAVAALGAAAVAVDQLSGNEATISTLDVAEEDVFTTQDCTQVENPDTCMQLYASITLP